MSTDDGYAFDDISLIDTVLSVLDDVAVSADGGTVYLTSHDTSETGAFDTSVWVKAGAWKRVLSIKQSDVATTYADANTAFLARLAPEDASVIYISAKNTEDMWVNRDSGEGKWTHVPCYKLDSVQDFAVESADVVHAMDLNGYSKSVNGGASWSIEESLDGLADAATLTLAPNNDVLVGGATGDVAFSTDSGASFTKVIDYTDQTVVHIVADKDYADNGYVYIAAGDEVERGKIAKGVTWSSREDDDFGPWDDTAKTGWAAKGIARSGGVIYVLTSDGTDSELWRALDLKTGATGDLCRWSYLSTGYELERTPSALRISGGNKL